MLHGLVTVSVSPCESVTVSVTSHSPPGVRLRSSSVASGVLMGSMRKSLSVRFPFVSPVPVRVTVYPPGRLLLFVHEYS